MSKLNAVVHLPSRSLPPLKSLPSLSLPAIALALDQLRQLYHPLRRSKYTPIVVPDSGYASCDEDDEEARNSTTDLDAWEVARNDTFERDFAIRWLTGFVSRAGAEWFASPATGGTLSDGDDDSAEDRERLIDDAASLLASCTNMPEEEDLSRTFSFGDGVDVVLRDETVGEDHTSVGLQTWGSSLVLARRMCQSPSSFGLARHPSGRPLRILELGAGTGLLSLVAAKILVREAIPACIVATDFHPSVLSNLEYNISSNFPKTSAPDVTIHVRPLDWRSFHETTPASPRALDPLLAQPFDVILGGDIVYNTLHASWIKSTVEHFLPRPNPHSAAGSTDAEGSLSAQFHLIVPLRPTYSAESKSVGIAFEPSRLGVDPGVKILEVEEIGRERGVGRADETGYKLYKIGWV